MYDIGLRCMDGGCGGSDDESLGYERGGPGGRAEAVFGGVVAFGMITAKGGG